MINSNKAVKYSRGSIWFVRTIFAEEARGIQNANRPCVIISSNEGNLTSDSVIVALITSRDKDNKGINVPFLNINNEENVILCNQIFTVSKDWLSYKSYGMLPESVMNQVEQSISIALSLNTSIPNMNDLYEVINNFIEVRTKEIESKNNIVTNSLVSSLIEKVNTETVKLEQTIKEREEKKKQRADKRAEQSGQATSKRGRKSKEEKLKAQQTIKSLLNVVDDSNTKEDDIALQLKEKMNKSAIKLSDDNLKSIDTSKLIKAKVEEVKATKEIKEEKKYTAKEEVKTEEVKTSRKPGRPKKVQADTNTEEKETTKKSSRKPAGFWTDEKKKEFIADRDVMSIDEIKVKWNMTNTKSIYQMYYLFRVQLGLN